MPGAKIPQDWDGTTWKCWVVEWPDSRDWFALLRGFTTTPKMGRYWDGTTGSIVSAQQTGIEIMERNLEMEECLMSCNEDTLAVFQGMLDQLTRLADKDCCAGGGGMSIYGGSRGAGIAEAPPSSYEETGSEDGGYTAHKCNAATDLVESLASDYISLSSVVYAGSSPSAVVAALVSTLLTPVPFDDLIAIATYIITTGYNFTFMAQMGDSMIANKSELICAIMEASNASDAKDAFMSEMERIAEETFPSPEDQEWVLGFVPYTLTYDAFNKPFQEASITVNQDAECDCGSDCLPQIRTTEVDSVVYPFGAIVSGSIESGTVTIESREIPWGGDPETPIEMVSLIGTGGCCWRLTAFSTSASDQYHYNDGDECGPDWPFPTEGSPPLDQCTTAMNLYNGPTGGTTTFTVTLSWEAC